MYPMGKAFNSNYWLNPPDLCACPKRISTISNVLSVSLLSTTTNTVNLSYTHTGTMKLGKLLNANHTFDRHAL